MPRFVGTVVLLCALCVYGSSAARLNRSHFSTNSEAIKDVAVNQYGDTKKDNAAMNAMSWQEVFDAYDVDADADVDEYVDAAEDTIDEHEEEIDGIVDAAEETIGEYDEKIEKYADGVNKKMDEYVEEYMRYIDDQKEENRER